MKNGLKLILSLSIMVVSGFLIADDTLPASELVPSSNKEEIKKKQEKLEAEMDENRGPLKEAKTTLIKEFEKTCQGVANYLILRASHDTPNDGSEYPHIAMATWGYCINFYLPSYLSLNKDVSDEQFLSFYRGVNESQVKAAVNVLEKNREMQVSQYSCAKHPENYQAKYCSESYFAERQRDIDRAQTEFLSFGKCSIAKSAE